MKIIGDHILQCKYRKKGISCIMCMHPSDRVLKCYTFTPNKNIIPVCAYDEALLYAHELFPKEVHLGENCPLNTKKSI
jgi:hypothetical protein